MITSNRKVKFSFAKLQKSWRTGKRPLSLTIVGSPEDNQLCVVETLDKYLEKAKPTRLDKTQVVFGFRKPYKNTVSRTISDWIKKLLTLANIGTSVYKGHSTRLVSTSNGNIKDLSLVDVLKRGSWSNKSTWQRFYNEEFVSTEEAFQKALLKKHLQKSTLKEDGEA